MRKIILGQGHPRETAEGTPEGEMEADRASFRPEYPRVLQSLTLTQLQRLRATQLTAVQDQRHFCFASPVAEDPGTSSLEWGPPESTKVARHISCHLIGMP